MDQNTRKKLIKEFSKLYPNPESELFFKNEYELVIAVALSAQCTDKKVNEVTPYLFKKYPDFKELSKARVASVEKIIKEVNYYRNKSKYIISMAKRVVEEFNSKLPKTHKELTSLAGVGRKTANVVLSELGIEPTFPVDTHVFRLSHRLGLSNAKTTDLVEEDMKKLFNSKLWRNLHHYLILHGRRVCKAQNPNCSECEISRICPSKQ
ncbi:UNVERIFIED_CONTAM: hypothetical protein GTU68_063528 [Idotea baltica]|nr:hypothetical protein [Idotea baltica]